MLLSLYMDTCWEGEHFIIMHLKYRQTSRPREGTIKSLKCLVEQSLGWAFVWNGDKYLTVVIKAFVFGWFKNSMKSDHISQRSSVLCIDSWNIVKPVLLVAMDWAYSGIQKLAFNPLRLWRNHKMDIAIALSSFLAHKTVKPTLFLANADVWRSEWSI